MMIDRNDAVAQEGDKGVSGVEVAFVVFEVFVGQQDLRDVLLVAGEELFVGRHQAGLADGGAGLEFVQLGRTFLVAQRAHPRAHRPRGYEHDLAPGGALGGHLGDQLFHLCQVGLFPAIGQNTGPQLDDDARDVVEHLAAHALLIAESVAVVE